jgi:hypothetical protein
MLLHTIMQKSLAIAATALREQVSKPTHAAHRQEI